MYVIGPINLKSITFVKSKDLIYLKRIYVFILQLN